jgi:hypothetical protein
LRRMRPGACSALGSNLPDSHQDGFVSGYKARNLLQKGYRDGWTNIDVIRPVLAIEPAGRWPDRARTCHHRLHVHYQSDSGDAPPWFWLILYGAGNRRAPLTRDVASVRAHHGVPTTIDPVSDP